MNIFILVAIVLLERAENLKARKPSVKCFCSVNRTQLVCSGLNLKVFPDFKNCVNITSIDFSRNRITKVPDADQLPKMLVKLDISYNEINHTGSNSLSRAHYLEELNLSGNKLITMIDGSKLPRSLLYLNISANILQSFGPNPFSNCFKLHHLDLHNNGLRYDGGIFYEHLFQNISGLAVIDIAYNSDKTEYQYPDEISKIFSLESLAIDGLAGATFGKGFKKLKKLKSVTIVNVNVEHIVANFFENLTQITKLTLKCKSHDFMKNATCRNLLSIETGAIAKLHRLRYLDVSGNVLLGLCGLRNITEDLQSTSIKILKAQNIKCPYGYSTVLFIDDIKPLNKTSIEELHLDKIRLEMTEDFAPTYLPKSLKVLSLDFNRLRLESYSKDGLANLTGIRELYLNSQDRQEMIDLPHWWKCNDFRQTLQCMQQRNTIATDAPIASFGDQLSPTNAFLFESNPSMNEFDYLPIIKDNRRYKLDIHSIDPHPEIRPENCTYLNHTFFKTWIPPKMKRVEFTYSSLGDIVMQQFLSEDTLEFVNMSGNHFYYLKGPVCNVTKVKVLDFSENKFSNITPYFFVGFKNLEELYIQENRIGGELSKFKKGVLFKNQKRLKILDMSSNRISVLPESFLAHNKHMQLLNLRHNMLTDWKMAVLHLRYLKHIDLSYNKISYLSADGMSKLEELLKTAKVTINLQNNTFSCFDHDSCTFFTWMDRHKLTFLYFDTYNCQAVDGSNLNLNAQLRNIKLACAPKVGLIIVVSSLILLSFGVIIGATVYRFRWHIRYWYYVAKRNHHKDKKSQENNRDFTFDAFLSYADDNRHLLQMMVAHFEDKEGMRLCIHHRDFIIGCDIADNITNAIHQSKKTVCLMSRAFLRSAWCMYELNISRVEGMWSRGGDNMIIIFQVDDMPIEEMPTQVIELLKNETYLEYKLLRHDRTEALNLLKTAIKH